MKTIDEILKPERDIIKSAESNCLIDEYYKGLITESDHHSALAFKYGMVTMNLAQQIISLQNKLNKK